MTEVTLAALGEVVEAPHTWDPAKTAPDDPFWYIDLSAVNQESKMIETPRTVAGREAPSRARQLVSTGDVLVATVRPNLNAVAMVPDDLNSATASTGFCVLRPVPERLDSRYLFHWVRTPLFVGEMVKRATGASYPAVSDRIIGQSTIPLPPLAEQRRLAEILDRADALRAKRRTALDRLDMARQSVFLDLFGDPAANDRAWPLAKIGDLATDRRGGANLAPDDFLDRGYPVLHKGALKPGGLVVLDAQKKTFTRDDFASAHHRSQVDRTFVVVTLRDLVPTGPTIGLAVNLIDGPFDRYLLAQGVVAFHLDENLLAPGYFVQLSNMPAFRQRLRQLWVGSTQIHIRNPIYFDIAIPVPPIKQQRDFDRCIAQIRTIRQSQATAEAHLDALFASLQHRVFRGEL